MLEFLGFTIQGLGFRVSDVGIQELFGFRVYDSGFRVQGLRCWDSRTVRV